MWRERKWRACSTGEQLERRGDLPDSNLCSGQHWAPSGCVLFTLLPSAPYQAAVGHSSASLAHSGVPPIQSELKLKDSPGYPTSSRIQVPHAFSGWGKGPLPHVAPNRRQNPLLFPSHLLECPTERALLAPTVLPPPRLLVGSELCPSPPSGCSALLFPRPTHHEGSHFFPRALLYLIGHLLQAAGVPFLWFTPQWVKMPPEGRCWLQRGTFKFCSPLGFL